MSEYNNVNIGVHNRLSHDNCAYQKKLYESTSPLMYRLYEGQFENCNKCTFNNQFWRPFDLVDIESELKNITRPNSKCSHLKYNPNKNVPQKQMPVIVDKFICPIVHNNIPRMTTPGYVIPNSSCPNVFKY